MSFNIRDKRYSRALKTSSVSIVVQIVNVITSLISVPLIVNAVGVERFGLWTALSAALSFLSFSDFGLGIGMQNKMSIYIGKKDVKKTSNAFVAAFYGAVFLSLSLCVIVVLFLQKINLSNVLKYEDFTITEELPFVIKSVAYVVALGLVAAIIQRVFDAHQEGFYHRYIGAFSRVLSIILLYICTLHSPSLDLLILIYNGIPHICLIVIGTYMCVKRYKLNLRFSNFSFIDLFSILKIGVLGLGAGLAMFFVTQSTPVLLSITYGLNDVATYSVIMRLLNFVVLFYNLMIIPLWPAITDAYSQNDIKWIKVAFNKTRLFVLLTLSLILFCFFIVGKPFILLWTHNEIIPSFSLIIACMLFVALIVWNTQVSVFLNGLSLFRGQATYGLILALFSIGCAYVLRYNVGQEIIIYIISIGLIVRNLFMEVELNINLKRCLYKEK